MNIVKKIFEITDFSEVYIKINSKLGLKSDLFEIETIDIYIFY